MDIVVLGSGMAGLLAAKAVFDVTGTRAEIVSNSVPKPIEWNSTSGIHVLHNDCGLGVPEMLVTNLVVLPLYDDGKPQLLASLSEWERTMANGTYGQKVYGSRNASTSLMRMPGVIEGYEYVTAFNKLVKMFGHDVAVYRSITEVTMHKMCNKRDLVISSIPRYSITPKWISHPFSTVYVSQNPPIGFAAEKFMGENFVVYNADPSQEWSRTSRVVHKGVEFWNTEYPSIPTFTVLDLRHVEKVSAGDTFAFPQNLLPVGRFGKWEPGVLAHDAYWDTVRELGRRGQ